MTEGELRRSGSTFVAERFFRPRESTPSTLDNGFLPDPLSAFGKAYCPGVCPRAEIRRTQCSVLLGAPGMGKSTEMAQRKRELPPGALFFDLRLCAAEDVLQGLRRANDESDSALHVVIDSVDEADLPNFAARFMGEVQKVRKDRLRLEMACRATEWPRTLETRLPQYFAPVEVTYFQIEPLRMSDAAQIVASAGVESIAFLEAIRERNLGALASVPLLLELLIQVFQKDGRFPHRTSEIYEIALLELCEEKSPTRLDRGRIVNAVRSVELASHLAAATILGNRPRVSNRSQLLEEPGLLSLARAQTLIGDVDQPALEEALATGLFTRLGLDTATFYHHSFAEFLAARWLQKSGLSKQQLRQLLFHHEATERLVPQLAGVATWLACADPEAAMLLAKYSPEHFIEADSPFATDEHRAVALDALMSRAQSLSLTNRWWSAAASRRLRYPGLAAKLATFIADPKWNPLVRRKAIDIANDNQLEELGEQLAVLALNTDAPASVRADAVDAAYRCISDTAKLTERLRPLAERGLPGDENEELRSAVLEQLWPKQVSAEELFRLLARPRRTSFSGRYTSFIRQVADNLAAADLVPALAWVEYISQASGHKDCIEFEDLTISICRKAWHHLSIPGLAEPMARAVRAVLNAYRSVFRGATHHADGDVAQFLAHDDNRRALLSGFARTSTDPANDVYRIVHPYAQPPLVSDSDVEWMLAQHRAATGTETAAFWSALVRQWLRWGGTTRSLELVLDEVDQAETSKLLPFPRVVYLDSAEAAACRKAELQEREWAWQRAQREQEQAADREVDVNGHLQRASTGDLAAWWQLIFRLGFSQERSDRNELLSIFDDSERTAIYVDLAKRYLQDEPTDAEEWLKQQNQTWHTASAGYLSIRLVSQCDAVWWNEHASALLRRWAPAVVGFSVHDFATEADRGAHRALLQRLFEAAPGEGTRMVELVLLREGRTAPDLSFLDFLPSNAPVGPTLEDRLTQMSSIRALERLFAALANIDLPRAIAHAQHRVAFGSALPESDASAPPLFVLRHTGAKRRERLQLWTPRRRGVLLRSVVRTLVDVIRPETWEFAKAAFAGHPGLQRAIFSQFTDPYSRNWGEHLPDADLAKLYSWLQRHLPLSNDPHAFDSKRMFRSNLLAILANRGTAAAIDALDELRNQAPTDLAPQWRFAEARERYAEQSWQPITPEALFSLRRSSLSRIVFSNEHLLEVIVEELEHYAAKLQGKPPAVVDLWSDQPQGRKLEDALYRPKDEQALSNHLKRHLRDALTGVIVNREVEIRPTIVEGGTGERADLLVEAVCPDTGKRFGVIIEVKGSWNTELGTQLEQQLCARYLADSDLNCGIYLVGWYACSQWAADDLRCGATRRRDRAEIEQLLAERATRSSIAGRSVRLCILDLTLGNG